MPEIINLALKWCNAKERWINHVYDNFVKKYPMEKRGIMVKIALGIKQQFKRQEIYDYFRYVEGIDVPRERMYSIPKDDLFMPFRSTINWRSLDKDMYNYWKIVVEWVEWFKKTHISIEDTYRHSLNFGNDKETSKSIIMSKYKLNNKLAEYLIKSFE